MQHSLHVLLGFLLGVLAVGTGIMLSLMRYVRSDMDGFRRWLDGAGTP